jgi:opacity protein-like surface antigen
MKIVVLIVAGLLLSTPAHAQSRRAGTSEIYIGPLFTAGKNYSFEGGSTAKVDDAVGFNFGYAFNVDQHWQAGFEIAWQEADYRATVQPGPGNPNAASNVNGTLESRVLRFNGTYNFLASDFTPFVTAGLGWSYIDTNIPSGLPELVCWYYPWYGQYCATYVPTESTTKFSYNVGAGLRLDFSRAGLVRFLVNSQYVDFGGSYGSSNVTQYRIDIGTKF